MCNKILWLEKGKQVCFSDNVEEACDAYEEFLITKKAPQGMEEIRKMAVEYQKRLALKKQPDSFGEFKLINCRKSSKTM